MVQVSIPTAAAVALLLLSCGALAGYLYGYRQGKRDGFEAGKSTGKDEAKREASIRAFAAGYERGKRKAGAPNQNSGSGWGCLVMVAALIIFAGLALVGLAT